MTRHIVSIIDSEVREYCEQNIIQGRDIESLSLSNVNMYWGNHHPIPTEPVDVYCELELTPAPDEAVDRMLEITLNIKATEQYAEVLSVDPGLDVIIADYGDLIHSDIEKMKEDIMAGRDVLQKEFVDKPSTSGIAVLSRRMRVDDNQQDESGVDDV